MAVILCVRPSEWRRRDRLFEARASFHQSFNDLLRGHFFADELQQGLSDGHIDLVFGGGIEDFFNGADTFGTWPISTST